MTMAIDFQTLTFEYRRSSDQNGEAPLHPVVVIGAGPVGLATAIDLAQQGTPVVLLDDDHTLSSGSRAICFAKRTALRVRFVARSGSCAPRVYQSAAILRRRISG